MVAVRWNRPARDWRRLVATCGKRSAQRESGRTRSPRGGLRPLWRRADVLSAYTTAISSARHAVRIAGGTEASAQCFDEPNGNVRLLAFEQRRALIGNQQLLTGDQRSQWPAHTAFVFAHRIFPAPECILLSTFLERDLLSH